MGFKRRAQYKRALLETRWALTKMSRWIQWIPAIGLEVHAPIRAAVKIFSGGLSKSSYESVNEAVAFFDLALPGSLPVRKL